MKQLKIYSILGIVFVAILGTLSHFFFEWSGNNTIIGLFSPVNESTWEHIKLLFFPMLLYSIFMIYKLKGNFPCLTSSLLLGILLGSVLIPVLFYTYTGILGFNTLPLDIATFFLSIIAAFGTVYKLTLSCKAENKKFLLKSLVLILAAAFFLFTYFPPKIGLFSNPVLSFSIGGTTFR